MGGNGYAYGDHHHRHYGNGGYDGYGGWDYGYNAYCSPYWLAVNPTLCYSGT
jgi:hypothetical protein